MIVQWIRFQRSVLAAASSLFLLLTGCATAPTHHAVTAGTSSTPLPAPTKTVDPLPVPTVTVSIQKSLPPVKKPAIPLISQGDHGKYALWLNEALAELGYLPLSFLSAGSPSSNTVPANAPPTNTMNAVYGSRSANSSKISGGSTRISLDNLFSRQLQSHELNPQSGTFVWKYDFPKSLTELWNPEVDTVITKGAVMSFERMHGLAVDGIAGPEVRAAMEKALQVDELDPRPYVYVDVTKSKPELLHLWENGKIIYTTLCNTGIAQSPTPNGTWPIYLRYRSQTMKGVNPWGTPYDDPGVPYVNYFYEGCAVHGFPRASYGFPQSLGCVELPISHAAYVWTILHYGTLVTVQA